MRRLALIVACCGLFQLFTPAPAQAWYEWIDQLSGPGPFNGVDYLFRLKCFPPPPSAPVQQTQQAQVPPSDSTNNSFWSVVGGNCPKGPLVNRTASVNLKVGYARSYENHLSYDEKLKDVNKAVNLWEVEPQLSGFVGVAKTLELTTGVGMMYFHGKAFDSFARFYWRPLAATIYPAPKDWKHLNGVSVTLGVLVFPMGFDAADFGAVQGTFHTNRDVIVTTSVSYDFRGR